MQWGYVESDANGCALYFPLAFSNTSYSIVAQIYSTGGSFTSLNLPKTETYIGIYSVGNGHWYAFGAQWIAMGF